MIPMIPMIPMGPDSRKSPMVGAGVDDQAPAGTGASGDVVVVAAGGSAPW